MPSLSPLDSPAGHPPSFGILCVGIERVVGVTAQRPLACQRSSKGAPMPIPAFQCAPKLNRGLTVLDAREAVNTSSHTIDVDLATLHFSFQPMFQKDL